jgi:hypothetical protein
MFIIEDKTMHKQRPPINQRSNNALRIVEKKFMLTRLLLILLLQVIFVVTSRPFLALGSSFAPQIQDAPSHLCGDEPHLAVLPVAPTTGDTIHLTAGGQWFNSCTPIFRSLLLEGSVIRIDLLRTDAPGIVCGSSFATWEITPWLPKLAAGEYQVELTVSGHPDSSSPSLCAGEAFTVTQGVESSQLPFALYLPLVIELDTHSRYPASRK